MKMHYQPVLIEHWNLKWINMDKALLIIAILAFIALIATMTYIVIKLEKEINDIFKD